MHVIYWYPSNGIEIYCSSWKKSCQNFIYELSTMRSINSEMHEFLDPLRDFPVSSLKANHSSFIGYLYSFCWDVRESWVHNVIVNSVAKGRKHCSRRRRIWFLVDLYYKRRYNGNKEEAMRYYAYVNEYSSKNLHLFFFFSSLNQILDL